MPKLTLLALLVLLTGMVPAQGHLYSYSGDSYGDLMGTSVSGAGDVNGDGYADFIIGIPGDATKGFAAGSAKVYSGANGALLYSYNGNSFFDSFGSSVCAAGDVNGDGYADFIIGAFNDDNAGVYSGSACVFSGLDGLHLYTVYGDSGGDSLGGSVHAAGDVNNDGYDDFIVGAYGDDNKGIDAGSARVYSGQNGTTLYTFDGESAGDKFGYSVCCAGDVNADGYGDLVVGAYLDDNKAIDAGSARVFSGKDGLVLYAFDGDAAGDFFGFSVSDAGDVNADGYADVIVGAYNDDNSGTDSGSACVFSGFDGKPFYVCEGDSAADRYGYSVSGAGDVNGDGYSDLIVVPMAMIMALPTRVLRMCSPV